MERKLEFRKKLNGILKLAEENGRYITIEETECYFEEDNLSKEQMELVFDYLLSQKVVVKGYEKTGGSVISGDEEKEEKVSLSAEEQAYLKEYKKDLAAMKNVSEEERKDLLEKAAAGDALAKSTLVESYLPEVLEIALEMHHPEVFLGDLVQEGNVGMLLGIDMLQGEPDKEETVRREIRQAIQMLIEEQTELKTRDKKMVEKVNMLDESIKELTEELGRKVSLEELAVYTGMSEEEVEDILRLTGEDTEEEGEEEDV